MQHKRIGYTAPVDDDFPQIKFEFEVLKTIIALSVVAIALIAWMITATIAENKRWHVYAAAHCKVVGRMDGDVGTGITSTGNGQVGFAVVTTPDKIGYLCDDGMTYWKEQ